MGSTSLLQHVYPLIKPTYLRSSSTHPHPFKVAASLHIHTPSTQPAMITMMNQAEAQRAAALELIQALVYRQDERLHDLCLNDSPAYHAFLSPKRLPALDDLADSPAMRMKQLLKRSNDMPSDLSARPSSPTSPTDDATHGAWSPLSCRTRTYARSAGRSATDSVRSTRRRRCVCTSRATRSTRLTSTSMRGRVPGMSGRWAPRSRRLSNRCRSRSVSSKGKGLWDCRRRVSTCYSSYPRHHPWVSGSHSSPTRLFVGSTCRHCVRALPRFEHRRCIFLIRRRGLVATKQELLTCFTLASDPLNRSVGW